jgi:hypothetical protein
MEMEDQLTPTQIKIIAGWSHIQQQKDAIFANKTTENEKSAAFPVYLA